MRPDAYLLQVGEHSLLVLVNAIFDLLFIAEVGRPQLFRLRFHDLPLNIVHLVNRKRGSVRFGIFT